MLFRSNPFIANTGEGNWHQSSMCASDWNVAGAHPMTALMPAAYEFTDQSISYHMLHFTAAGQPPETELLGYNCEAGPNNYVLATRRYPSGGTFTYMALDIGPYSDAASGPNFVQPFLQGYLAVDSLWLYLNNGNVLGGGQPTLTGPSFIDTSNIDAVAEYAKAGTR